MELNGGWYLFQHSVFLSGITRTLTRKLAFCSLRLRGMKMPIVLSVHFLDPPTLEVGPMD